MRRQAKQPPAEVLYVTREPAKARRTEKSARPKDDLTVTFPQSGQIAFHSVKRFSGWSNNTAREFVEQSMGIKEVREVEIDSVAKCALVSYDGNGNSRAVLKKIAGVYRGEIPLDGQPVFDLEAFKALPKTQPRLRVFRYGQTLSTWELRLRMPGWVRLRNALILNKRHLAQFIERELMALIGVDRYKMHASAGSITIEFDERLIHLQQLVLHLDMALAKAPANPRKSKREDAGLPVASVSLGLAAASTFAAPALFPASAALMLVTAVPSYKRATRVVMKEKRLGVDVLDSIIFTACLFTGQIFAGAMTAWFLTFGRKLLRKTENDSAKVLLQAFGRQPSMVWLLRDGTEVETSLERISAGDSIVVHTGEAVPVDGVIKEGDAILDQHMLTGESAPAEKPWETEFMLPP